ncbi:MAG TPA: hypothetical protein VF423_09440 [Actinomycetes bacterium]
MTKPSPDTSSTSTTLHFQAPPELPQDETDVTPEPAPSYRSTTPPRGGETAPASGGSLRMLKGARQAAAGMKISDDEIRAVLEDPQDVQPDPNQPHRTRLRRNGVIVTTGNDGMILRVSRKG